MEAAGRGGKNGGPPRGAEAQLSPTSSVGGQPAATHPRASLYRTKVGTAWERQRFEDQVGLHQAKQQRRSEEASERCRALQQWSEARASHGDMTYGRLDLASLAEFRPGPGGMDIAILHPPAAEIAAQVMSTGTERRSTAVAAARKAWQKATSLGCHKDAPKLAKTGSDAMPKRCWHAGFCVCQAPVVAHGAGNRAAHGARGAGRTLDAFARRLQTVLGRILAKGSPARSLYEVGALVLCLRRKDWGEDVVGLWWHIGYGNLTTGHFSGLPLFPATGARQAEATGLNLVALELRGQLSSSATGVHNVWSALAPLDPAGEWELEAYSLHSSKRALGRIIPGKQILVERLTPAVVASLTGPSPPGGDLLPIRRPRRPQPQPRPRSSKRARASSPSLGQASVCCTSCSAKSAFALRLHSPPPGPVSRPDPHPIRSLDVRPPFPTLAGSGAAWGWLRQACAGCCMVWLGTLSLRRWPESCDYQ